MTGKFSFYLRSEYRQVKDPTDWTLRNAGIPIRKWVPNPIAKFYARIQPHLPEWSFITIHYLYFIGTCMVSSLIIWGSSTSRKVGYTDSLFLAVSAMTEAGALYDTEEVVLHLLKGTYV